MRAVGVGAAGAILLLAVACLSGGGGPRQQASTSSPQGTDLFSQLAMVSPGSAAGQGDFQFQIPPGLQAGQRFVVDMPSGLGSHIVQVEPGMQPGQSIQMQFPASQSMQPQPQPQPQPQTQIQASLPALGPLPLFPYAPAGQHSATMHEWYNRPSPVQNDDASALALLKWHPAQAWAGQRASQERLEERIAVRNAQPKLWKEVHTLQHELAVALGKEKSVAADRRQLGAEAKQLEKKLALEKKQLLQEWRQGEKELGGREEAEARAQQLRKQASSNQQEIAKLQSEVKSRENDVRVLKGVLAKSSSKISTAVEAEKENMQEEMRGEAKAIAGYKSALAAENAELAKYRAHADVLAKIRGELLDRENDMLEMEHKDEVQGAQLRAAQNAVVEMIDMQGGGARKQAALMLSKDAKVEEADDAEISELRKKLSEGANATPTRDGKTMRAEVKRLKTQYLRAAFKAAGNDALAAQVKSLKAQAAEMNQTLARVVRSEGREALQRVDEEAGKVEDLRSKLKVEEHAAAKMEKAKGMLAERVAKLIEQLSARDKLLSAAQEQAGSAPLLKREVEKDDSSMREASWLAICVPASVWSLYPSLPSQLEISDS